MNDYCRLCCFNDKGVCFVSLEYVREILVYCPVALKGASNCNRLYRVKRKGERQLYEKFGYKPEV